MEFGKLEREVLIEATPDVVFDVVSRPEHISRWWADKAELDPVAGAVGELSWDGRDDPERIVVVEALRPTRFSFRWVADDGPAVSGNSLLVTFDIVPAGDRTILRLTESGWREKGWEVAVLEEAYRDHESGWDAFLPRLRDYAPSVASR